MHLLNLVNLDSSPFNPHKNCDATFRSSPSVVTIQVLQSIIKMSTSIYRQILTFFFISNPLFPHFTRLITKRKEKKQKKSTNCLKKKHIEDDAFILLGRLSKDRFLFLLFISIIKISLSSLFSFSRWNSICADNTLFSARNKEFKYFLPFVIRVFRFSLSFFAAFSKWRGKLWGEILKLNYFVSEHKKANPIQRETANRFAFLKGPLW